ncbi:MAG TPA: outer membrane protein transport protein [Polyangiaceae bacterium]
MPRQSGRVATLTAALVATLVARAHATTEPPTNYDARSVGMGSTSAANTHSATAVYHNAGELAEVQTFTGTAAIAPTLVPLRGPADGPNTQVDSKSTVFPTFFLGAGYRLSDRVVIGLATYAVGGFGAEYSAIALPPGTPPGVPPPPNGITVGAFELSPAAAFEVTKNFSIGVGYRASYVIEQLKLSLPTPPAGALVAGKANLSGASYLGGHLGLYFRATPQLRFGLAYRTKTTTKVDGKLNAGPITDTWSSKFSFPHSFRVGFAYDVIPDKLTVALDLRYLLYSESNKEIVIHSSQGDQTQTLNWINTFAVGGGLEYVVSDMIPVRAGYVLTQSATPKDHAGFFFVPPGLIHSIHAGVGVKLSKLELDLGGYYAFGGSDVDNTPNGYPGHYGMKTYVGSLSVNYRM